MSTRRSVGGGPELGQNLLTDPRIAARVAALVPPGPVLELGAGAAPSPGCSRSDRTRSPPWS